MGNTTINLYTDKNAYDTDTERPTNKNCVSKVGNAIIYDKKNVILKPSQVADGDVCVVVKDNTNGKFRMIPIETYEASTLDTGRYIVENFIRFGKSFGKHLLIHKNDITTSIKWSDWNKYRLHCDTSSNGSFHWAITINGNLKEGDVSWEEEDSLDSIVSQLNQGAVTTYLTFSHIQGEEFIRIQAGGYSVSTFTLTNTTGAESEDLSEKCKINGVLQTNKHRGWQNQGLSTIFPEMNFAAPTTVQYNQGDYNLSYTCGANLNKYKSYYKTNGRATYISETTISSRMSEAGFADLANQSGDALALYNKYNGSWNAYMEASMIKINERHANGAEYLWYDNGKELSEFMKSVTTEDYDGTWYCPFLAAESAATITHEELGQFCIPTNHEIAMFMRDEIFAKINTAIEAIGGTKLAQWSHYWCCGEYGDYYAWIYSDIEGTLRYNYKFYQYSGVRPALASILQD